jgi:soluble lytic murein transglycosylase-like protein
VRLLLVVLSLTLLFSLARPLRAAAAAFGRTLSAAMRASRGNDMRRVATAAYAVRYGVSFPLASAVYRAAEDEGIDPELAFRLVDVESEFHEHAVSPAGALGLTQLMPATAAELRPGITRDEIFERDTNLHLGFRYLRTLIRVYHGRVPEALHAYNRGPGTVDRFRAAGGDPANGYADRVLGSGRSAYLGNGLTE